MKKSNTKEHYFFIGFGVVTILSGIYLLIQGDYLIGASGSCVGFLLLYQNVKASKMENDGK